MKEGAVFITMLLVLCNKGHSIDVSSIDCGDGCSAIDGSSYTLTCRWSGSVAGGIIWKRGGTSVVTCNTAACDPSVPGYASGSYVDSQTAQMTITSFSNTDVGTWECTDSPGTSKSCSLRQLEKRNIKLEAVCSTRTVTCKLDDHGTPPITLELRDETVNVSTNSAGVLTMSASGGMKTCAVIGEGSQCASTKQMTVSCYGIGPPVAAIVVVLICVITVIVLLVLIMNGPMHQMDLVFYVFEVILIIIALVFIIVLFVIYTDYDDALFIVAVVIVFAGLIVAIVAFIIHRLLQ